ncbi:MAG: amidohydrolase family protein [Lachnospiraceae bacterium]|nr:amidohydrolase family protein [Lachnospiraceae bacterium]
MEYDWILRGGRVIDPASGTDEIRDVYVRDGRIADNTDEIAWCGGKTYPAGQAADGGVVISLPERVIDAAGLIVTPGLIDFHAHVYCLGSALSVRADELLRQGTTTVVDAGTCGCADFDTFAETVIQSPGPRIRAFLNVAAGGLSNPDIPEDYDPAGYDTGRIEETIRRYGDGIIGLKIRLSKGIVPEDRAAYYLDECISLAGRLEERLGRHLRVCVHTTDSPVPAGDLAEMLRPGDIFCHCYAGAGSTILTEKGEIDPKILAARKRGVLFDAANGKANFCLDTAKRALAAGFLPDIISTDLTSMTCGDSPYVGSLPRILSKYMELGLTLSEAVGLCTQAPAQILGEEGEIGTLRPGARADIAVFRLEDTPFMQKDFRGDTITCKRRLVPVMTILSGG